MPLDREIELPKKRRRSLKRGIQINVAKAMKALERACDVVDLSTSLLAFVEAAWHILEPATPYKSGKHIEAICAHLEAVTRGDHRNLLINMPPRHMKSLAVSVFWPAWVWTFAPHKKFIFSSYAQTLSSRDSRKFRNLITSDWYTSRWGNKYHLTSDQNTKLEIVNSATGHRIATSVGASGTGKGGDFVVVDDPMRATDASSKAKRDRVKVWWNEEMSTRLNPTGSRCRVIVMQRLHHDDLAGACLASEVDWCHLNLPARYEGDDSINAIGHKDWRTELGQLLWPEGCGEERLKEIETALASEYAIAGQLQQRPVPRSGGIVKRAWFVLVDRLPTKFDRVVISADFSHGSMSRAASYNVFTAWGQVGSTVFLLDVMRFKAEFPEAMLKFKSFITMHPTARAKLVEDKAMGRSVIQTLKRSIPGIIAINPGDRDKVARLEAVAPYIQAGNVHIYAQANWLTTFLFELCNYPGASNDDQVDCTSQALEYMQTSGMPVRASHL